MCLNLLIFWIFVSPMVTDLFLTNIVVFLLDLVEKLGYSAWIFNILLKEWQEPKL